MNKIKGRNHLDAHLWNHSTLILFNWHVFTGFQWDNVKINCENLSKIDTDQGIPWSTTFYATQNRSHLELHSQACLPSLQGKQMKFDRSRCAHFLALSRNIDSISRCHIQVITLAMYYTCKICMIITDQYRTNGWKYWKIRLFLLSVRLWTGCFQMITWHLLSNIVAWILFYASVGKNIIQSI